VKEGVVSFDVKHSLSLITIAGMGPTSKGAALERRGVEDEAAKSVETLGDEGDW